MNGPTPGPDTLPGLALLPGAVEVLQPAYAGRPGQGGLTLDQVQPFLQKRIH